MNQTYIKDADENCEVCGETLEVHQGAVTCSKFDCPSKAIRGDMELEVEVPLTFTVTPPDHVETYQEAEHFLTERRDEIIRDVLPVMNPEISFEVTSSDESRD